MQVKLIKHVNLSKKNSKNFLEDKMDIKNLLNIKKTYLLKHIFVNVLQPTVKP